jgi:hypothetical protein
MRGIIVGNRVYSRSMSKTHTPIISYPVQAVSCHTLDILSTDILLFIFDELYAVSSTCLGLTCKWLYNMSHDLYGEVL